MVKSGNSTIVRSAARTLDVLEIVVQAEKAPTFTMIQKAYLCNRLEAFI